MAHSEVLAQMAPAGYFENLEAHALSPGWAKKVPQMWAAPRSRFVPTVWRYAQARAALDAACAFVSPEFAERRNLIMVNPVPDNVYPTCRNLVAAYQLVLPGEIARSHRHAPNALRLILDAGGATSTIVNGERIEVAPGDVVLTPSWHWHGHSNTGDTPAFWIDFLDVPLVQNLECMFFEDHPQRNEPARGDAPDSPLRHKGEVLARLARERGEFALDTGSLHTTGVHVLGLERGAKHSQPKRIDNNLYTVVTGSVRMTIERLGTIELTRGDVAVVPCWHEFAVEGTADWSQLVRVTDEPALHVLGFRDVSAAAQGA
ncbi:gentisate 1,2-dioxygenase [Burkholderia multivorans]|uniref:cupin domain-containing protein n=1 Tax=Burkholderia multivorans TaxID=87883 RepID=UPI0019910025|nr:cupin domain-containing protein [Burkholderia multivorans]MBU9669192.1 cupin domain-containing protein [Burkholderia multivorans]CAB5300998.1 gentisate 1,2-dioxygenase [Burkholderia multivorans]CAB5305543.1 gentisate 1,2-dioxygenase [Burkholderia multivorans]CAB5310507.1 gentisate 1,2-dioxygenase [Burkholderia multivorans]CAB5312531.1 gentisate 1,2-dioxygenase [Burkholderia multivorans]